jgi:hypothetical protein
MAYMKKSSIVVATATIMLSFCFFAVPTKLFGQIYIAPEVTYNYVFGKFDGANVLAGEWDIFLLPRLKGGLGYGGTIGIISENNDFWGNMNTRRGTAFGAGFRYSKVLFDAEFENENLGKAMCNSFVLELILFSPAKFWQTKSGRSLMDFKFTFGTGMDFLTVPDGHLSLTGVSNDAKFTSLAFPFGGGIAIKPARWLGITLGVVYNFAFLMNVKEITSGGEKLAIEDFIVTGGPSINIGLCFLLGKMS